MPISSHLHQNHELSKSLMLLIKQLKMIYTCSFNALFLISKTECFFMVRIHLNFRIWPLFIFQLGYISLLIYRNYFYICIKYFIFKHFIFLYLFYMMCITNIFSQFFIFIFYGVESCEIFGLISFMASGFLVIFREYFLMLKLQESLPCFL